MWICEERLRVNANQAEAKYREWGKRLAKDGLARAPEAGTSGEYKATYDSTSEEKGAEECHRKRKGIVGGGAYEFLVVQLLSSARSRQSSAKPDCPMMGKCAK